MEIKKSVIYSHTFSLTSFRVKITNIKRINFILFVMWYLTNFLSKNRRPDQIINANHNDA